MNPNRLTLDKYALALASTASLRSEDPFYQVGAVAMTNRGRVIATAYNGLLPGIKMPETWWNDKEGRKPYMIHAEQNLCSLFSLGDQVNLVAVTLQPCPDCMRLLMAHGVQRVIYTKEHPNSAFSEQLANFYGVILEQVL